MSIYFIGCFNNNDCIKDIINTILTGLGFSKYFCKVMTISANEVIIVGSIGPAINIWLALYWQLMIHAVQGIISWPYHASQIFITGPKGPAIISSLARIVITLLKSFENPPPELWSAVATIVTSHTNFCDPFIEQCCDHVKHCSCLLLETRRKRTLMEINFIFLIWIITCPELGFEGWVVVIMVLTS